MTGNADGIVSNPVLWTPSDPDSTQCVKFRNFISERYSLRLENYEQLHQWSITKRADFWLSVWEYEQVIGQLASDDKDDHSWIVDESARPKDNPSWFRGTKVNWTENQLRHVKGHEEEISIIQTSEKTDTWFPPCRRYTWAELQKAVKACQEGMKSHGIVKGDRVAWYGGNCFESVVVLLAVVSLGGIFSSAAADFGVDGVIERLEQVCGFVLF